MERLFIMSADLMPAIFGFLLQYLNRYLIFSVYNSFQDKRKYQKCDKSLIHFQGHKQNLSKLILLLFVNPT